MPSALSLAYTVALLAAASPRAAAGGVPAGPDSAAEASILRELRAFYRDLDAGRWSATLDHFLPAKVTARWAPPEASSAWVGLRAPPAVPAPESSGRSDCAPRAAVALVGDWARVLVRRCAAPADEAWLLRVSGRWKIVHLEVGASADPGA